MLELTVPATAAGVRLDRFLATALSHLSRTRVQTLIRDGFVQVNARPGRPADPVRPSDVITWEEPAPTTSTLEPESIALSVLYEDEDLLVIDKAAGMVTHPAPGNQEHTLVHALLAHCRHLSGIGGERRPGIVHRLDKDTSGCLVIACNDRTHAALSAQFAGRTTRKHYLALVHGVPAQPAGRIEAPIGRHPVHRKKMAVVEPPRGRLARTDYTVLAALPGLLPGESEAALVECRLHTGRTHQVRVHMQHLGHPILGDSVYGRARLRHRAPAPRQLLHAWKLGFVHPGNGREMEFEAPLPADFRAFGLEAFLK